MRVLLFGHRQRVQINLFEHIRTHSHTQTQVTALSPVGGACLAVALSPVISGLARATMRRE